MKRALLILLLPPYAACRFGCAGCCAAPIGVFWLASLTSVGYGLMGGPTNLMGPSLNTLLLGLVMWGISVVWAAITVRSANEERCANRGRKSLCNNILPGDESDPFDEVRKAR
ncbi:MAG TPA: hypothetical protein ENJ79_10260 [Gammaproteobacteria bacterium]|nr:hypothetical protein [Gammaproteobacteria bacterium]